jgi:hypothetical protein
LSFEFPKCLLIAVVKDKGLILMGETVLGSCNPSIVLNEVLVEVVES